MACCSKGRGLPCLCVSRYAVESSTTAGRLNFCVSSLAHCLRIDAGQTTSNLRFRSAHFSAEYDACLDRLSEPDLVCKDHPLRQGEYSANIAASI